MNQRDDELRVKVIERSPEGAADGRFARTVTRLLSFAPQEALIGLDAVVLTRDNTRLQREVHGRRGEAVSYYHLRTRDRAPWIEIFVDRITANFPRITLRVSFIRELMIAKPLFHEVAHHRNAVVGGLRPASHELMADAWALDMSREYFARHYWYFRPFAKISSRLLRAIGASRKPRGGRETVERRERIR